MPSLVKLFLLDGTTAATHLAAIFGRNEQHARTSLFRFILALLHELTPTSIQDTLV
jgi:hypothetical protein